MNISEEGKRIFKQELENESQNVLAFIKRGMPEIAAELEREVPEAEDIADINLLICEDMTNSQINAAVNFLCKYITLLDDISVKGTIAALVTFLLRFQQSKNNDGQILGNEIFERIKKLGKEEFKFSLEIARKLGDKSAVVSDGELLDAFFELYTHLDMSNPLLPLASAIFERYMLKIGMKETPHGFNAEWFHEDEDWSDEIQTKEGE